MKISLLTICLVLISWCSYAQEDVEYQADTVESYNFDYADSYADTVNAVSPEALTATKEYTQEDIKLRKFDADKWKEIVGDETFEEQPPKPEKEPEIEEKKEREGFSPNFSLNPELLKTVSYIIIFVLLAIVLYYVARNVSYQKQTVKKFTPVDAAAPVENIEELDIDALLRNALASGDLRLAVRVHYLMLLKKLNEFGLIIWKKDKTNRDYLSELYARNDYYENVRMLTLAYELVWYGERAVSQESYKKLSTGFDSVNQLMSREKPQQ